MDRLRYYLGACLILILTWHKKNDRQWPRRQRVFTLAPGEAIPWHYHRQSTDHYFFLEGVVSISTREPEIIVTSPSVGSSHKISLVPMSKQDLEVLKTVDFRHRDDCHRLRVSGHGGGRHRWRGQVVSGSALNASLST